MGELSERDVARLRTASLLLSVQPFQRPAEVAHWFGAMQAQDLASGLWSFGVRLPHLDLAGVEAAVEAGEVLRTWPMRGTLHFIESSDARWLLALTGVRALARAAARRAYLGLDLATVTKAADVVGDRLAGGGRMTRAALIEELGRAGIETAGQHAYHLLWYVSQIGVTCVGPNEGKEQSFVLLDEWAPEQRAMEGDEALAELALRYFRSHGPTTRQDFAGWAGITAAEAKAGIAGAGGALVEAGYAGAQAWMAAELPDRAADIVAGGDAERVRLLPGFDEFMLGYKDRSIPLPREHAQRIVPGNNGVFQPTVVVDGRVFGTWRRAVKRTVKGARVEVRPETFAALSARRARSLESAAADYARFMGLELALVRPQV